MSQLMIVIEKEPKVAEIYCANHYVERPLGNPYVGKLDSALKRTLLSTSKDVIAATGGGGAGKTTALLTLGRDKAVREKFRDGVLQMTLGADAIVGKVTENLTKIMKQTGAIRSARDVKNESNLEQAIVLAAGWFRNKCSLFLIDDLWKSSESYWPQLRQLIAESPESRIAMTTRIDDMGAFVHNVDFDVRDMEASESIFLKYATNCKEGEGVLSVRGKFFLQEILKRCEGLPIFLSTAGNLAAKRRKQLGFENACDDCLKKLTADSEAMAALLEPSLEHLDLELNNTSEIFSSYSVHELFVSLCVLKKKQWFPVAVLACMCGMDYTTADRIAWLFNDMSLVQVLARDELEEEEELGVTIHDFHHDYCLKKAQSGCVLEKSHSRLLDGFMPSLAASVSAVADPGKSQTESFEHALHEQGSIRQDQTAAQSISGCFPKCFNLRDCLGTLADEGQGESCAREERTQQEPAAERKKGHSPVGLQSNRKPATFDG